MAQKNQSQTAMAGNIRKMYIVSFLRNLTFFGAIAIPFFLDWGRLNYAAIFLLESAFSLAIVVAQVPTGVFADKYGRRLSLFAGFLVTVLGIIVLILQPSFLSFLAAEIIWGLGSAFLSGADRAFVFDCLKQMDNDKKSKEVFARISIAETAGAVIGLPAGSLVAGLKIMPYPEILQLPFLLTAVPYLAAAAVAFLLLEPERRASAKSLAVSGLDGIKELKANPLLRSLALDMTMISMLSFFMYWFYQSLLRVSGTDIAYFGLVAAGFNAISMLLLWKITPIEKFFGSARFLYFSALAIGVLYVAVGFTQYIFVSLLAIVAITSLRVLRQPVFEHYINFQIESRQRATILSSVNLLERLGMVVLYPLIGFLADISLQTAFLFLGGMTLVFAFFLRSHEDAFEKGR